MESDETNQQQQTELPKKMTKKERQNNRKYRKRNEKAAKDLDFEKATELRDMLFELKAEG